MERLEIVPLHHNGKVYIDMESVVQWFDLNADYFDSVDNPGVGDFMRTMGSRFAEAIMQTREMLDNPDTE